jgi:hypothetical protein
MATWRGLLPAVVGPVSRRRLLRACAGNRPRPPVDVLAVEPLSGGVQFGGSASAVGRGLRDSVGERVAEVRVDGGRAVQPSAVNLLTTSRAI